MDQIDPEKVLSFLIVTKRSKINNAELCQIWHESKSSHIEMLLEAFEFVMNFYKLMVQTVYKGMLVQNMRFESELCSRAVVLLEYNFD
jgi:hypothetical protein